MSRSMPPASGRHWLDTFDGTRLAALRRARGWSQVRLAEAVTQLQAHAGDNATEIARRIRTLVVQVSCYESGRNRPRARAARDLAKALGVDVRDLLADGGSPTLPRLRARLGLTQADVAAALHGMSRSTYAHIEQGRRRLRVPELAALATILHVAPETISRATGSRSQP
jgi:transcriptional regulator with XRE-family HTH domain